MIGVSSHAEGNAALIEAGADAICPKLDFASIGRVLDEVCPNPLIRTLALAKLEPTELVNLALAHSSLFKRIHEALERRGPTGEAARVLSEAYRSGRSPRWPLMVA